MRRLAPTALAAVVFLGLPAGTVSGSAADAAGPAGEPAAAPRPSELREQLTPIYHRLLTDAQYLSFQQRLETGFHDRELIDSYLAFLPMSPKDLLEIDMEQRRYEHVVPRFIQEWHELWIRFHPELARRRYGDAIVDLILGRGTAGEVPVTGRDAASPGPVVDTNRNLAAASSPAPDLFQGEIQVVVNPNDPDEIVAAANTWHNIPGTCSVDTQAIFYSSDGGVTWGYTCAPDHAGFGLTCGGGVFGSDPALHWDSAGNVFINYLLLCTAGGTHYALVVAWSTDGGATWSPRGIVKNSWPTTDLEDKNFYAIDNHPGSPFFGRHYDCWDRNNDEKLARSTNGGVNWTEADLPPTGAGSNRFDLACEMAIEDDGTVHVVYDTLTCPSNCANEEMFHSKSTDGGVNWSTPVLVRDFNLVGFSGTNCPDPQNNRCINPFGSIDVDNTGGACDGILYATFSDFTSGNVNNNDIWVSRSMNGGATWGAPVRVNDDGAGAPIQFHPFLAVDQSNGNVDVAWHDTRNDTPDFDQVDFFAARSTDCGLTFEANVQASQPSSEFNESAISWTDVFTSDNPVANPNQFGEYMGFDVLNGTAYLAWTDTRHYFPGFKGEIQAENLGFTKVVFDASHIFSDGFETGDTSHWSSTLP
jgi:hypothetical protein